jgi:hypothetical protein
MPAVVTLPLLDRRLMEWRGGKKKGGEGGGARAVGSRPMGITPLAWVRYSVELPLCCYWRPAFVRVLALFPFSFFSLAMFLSLYSEFRLRPSVCINARGFLRELRHDLVCITMPVA